MKRILVTAMLLIGVFCLFGQNYEGEWAIKAGGVQEELSKDIVTDSDGNSYLVGSFQGESVFGNTTLASAGNRDGFVAKVNSEGKWVWVKRVGGTGLDQVNSLSLNDAREIVITGLFEGSVTFGNKTLVSAGKRDVFIAKLSNNGEWQWAVSCGGEGNENATAVVTDLENSVYVTGTYQGSANFGDTKLVSSEGTDLFVVKIDNDGDWVWAKRAGGSFDTFSTCMVVDESKALYVGGYFKGTAAFGSNTLNSVGGEDGFVARMNHAGNWQWAKRCGSEKDDRVTAVGIDSAENVVVSGYFQDLASFGAYELENQGGKDLFVAKLNNSGSWQWAKAAGGEEEVAPNSMVIDSQDNILTAGYFSGSIYVGEALFNTNGGWDMLITMMDKKGDWIWGRKQGGIYTDQITSICMDGDDNVLVTGTFQSDMKLANKWLSSSGGSDIFVAKLTTDVSAEESVLPSITKIDAKNYPNPFNPQTTIQLNIPNSSEINLSVYNTKGALVKTLVNKRLETGTYSYVWNGDDQKGKPVASGVYFYRVENGGETFSKRMILLK